jgi:ketosteroid isomerase-like protein
MKILHFVFLVSLFFAASCGGDQDKAIEEVMSKRTEAFETKDADLYMTLIAPGYKQEKKGKVIGPGEIKKNFEVNVKLFDTVKLTHTDRTIYQDGDRAEVFQKTLVDAVDDEGKIRLKLNERILLARENGKWVIVRESDEDLFYGYVFGRSKD